jgi:DNA polymerase-3 subunit beta
MRLRSEREAVVEAVSTVARAASSRTAGSGGLHLQLEGDRLQLLASDTELTIDLPLAVHGEADGEAVVPARLFLEVLRSMPAGAVGIEGDEDEIRLTGGRSTFSLRTLTHVEPVLRPAATTTTEVPAADLAEAFRQVARAASNDSERPSLTGVLLEADGGGTRVVATDLYRLALRDLAGVRLLPDSQSVLLPARALQELQRLLPSGGEEPPKVGVAIGELDASFVVGTTRLTTRQLRAEFPNYAPLVPKGYPNRLIVDKTAFLEALRRVRILVRDMASSVRLSMEAGRVELTATSYDFGSAVEELDASYEGDDLSLAFNPSFLIEGVEVVVGDDVVIEMRDAGKPALVRALERDDYRYLLMPVRVA